MNIQKNREHSEKNREQIVNIQKNREHLENREQNRGPKKREGIVKVRVAVLRFLLRSRERSKKAIFKIVKES